MMPNKYVIYINGLHDDIRGFAIEFRKNTHQVSTPKETPDNRGQAEARRRLRASAFTAIEPYLMRLTADLSSRRVVAARHRSIRRRSCFPPYAHATALREAVWTIRPCSVCVSPRRGSLPTSRLRLLNTTTLGIVCFRVNPARSDLDEAAPDKANRTMLARIFWTTPHSCRRRCCAARLRSGCASSTTRRPGTTCARRWRRPSGSDERRCRMATRSPDEQCPSLIQLPPLWRRGDTSDAALSAAARSHKRHRRSPVPALERPLGAVVALPLAAA